MSRELFPAIQSEAVVRESLPIPREVAWDFETNTPVYEDGKPKEVTGTEAVRVWIWKALHTQRCRYDIYTWDFGNELEDLIGSGLSDELKQAEAVRFIKEALAVSPYIDSVEKVEVKLEGDRMELNCKVKTIYGEVDIVG